MEIDPLVHKHSNLPYIYAVVALVVAVLIAIVTITAIRPSQDNMQLFVLIFGMLTTITVAFLGFIKSNESVAITHEAKDIAMETKVIQIETQAKQEVIHEIVNSRMTEMMEIVRKLALTQGMSMGIEKGIEQEVKRVAEVQAGREQGVQEGTETGTAAGVIMGTEQALQRAKEDTQLLKDAGFDPKRNP